MVGELNSGGGGCASEPLWRWRPPLLLRDLSQPQGIAQVKHPFSDFKSKTARIKDAVPENNGYRHGR